MENKPKIISKIKPHQMVAVFNGNTPLQGSFLAKEFIGLWIKTSGKIIEISESSSYVSFVFNDHKNICIYASFDKPYSQELMIINKGDYIRVEGQIFRANEDYVSLDHCKLVDEDREDNIETSANNTEDMTNEELELIIRKNENSNVPESRYNRAKNELEIRHRKIIEESLQKPATTIGILNQGKNNKFIGNRFKGIDIDIKDKREGARAKENKFSSTSAKEKNWFEKWWGQILIGLFVLIVGTIFLKLIGIIK